MKAYEIDAFGLDGLKLIERPTPEPGAHQVLGVWRRDSGQLVRLARHRPRIPPSRADLSHDAIHRRRSADRVGSHLEVVSVCSLRQTFPKATDYASREVSSQYRGAVPFVVTTSAVRTTAEAVTTNVLPYLLKRYVARALTYVERALRYRSRLKAFGKVACPNDKRSPLARED